MTTLSRFVAMPVSEQQAMGLEFTPREIAQQPATWKSTLDIFQKNQERICRFLEEIGLKKPVEQRPAVMLVGAGTSDYIGQALVLLLRQSWGCEVMAIPSTDLLPNLEDYIVPGRPYLWISFSRSGDSPEAVAVLEKAIARFPDVAHLIVTCNENARMITVCKQAKHSCVVILDPAVNDRSLAMTSSFSNMVVMGQCLANAGSIESYQSIFEQLVEAGEKMLVCGVEEAERLAAKDYSRVCLVGAGSLFSVAKESALKVLEMTAGGIKTMSETVLGLRHGPMAALDAQTLFVCFISSDDSRALYGRDLLREIGQKEVVAARVAVGPASRKEEIAPVCETYLSLLHEIPDAYRPPVDVIFGQSLGLFCSVFHKLKPDAPSPGGVINRVVQKFEIY